MPINMIKEKKEVVSIEKEKKLIAPKVDQAKKAKRKANPIKVKDLEDEIALLEADIEKNTKELEGVVTEYEKIEVLDKTIKALEHELEIKMTQYYDLIDD